MGARASVRPIIAAALACAFAVAGPAAGAELWQWTDAEGVVRYTNDPETIPPAFRARARDVGSPQPRAPAASVPSAPAPEPAPPAGTAVLPTEPGASIKAPVSFNGVPLVLIVDTGASRTMISPSAAARAGIDIGHGEDAVVTGVTGSALVRRVTVERLDVAGRQLGPFPVIVYASAIPSADVDGLLGRDVLDHFTLTVEPGSRRAVLTPR